MLICICVLLTISTLTIPNDEKSLNNQNFPKSAQIEEINYNWLITWENNLSQGRDMVLDDFDNIYLTGRSDGRVFLVKYTDVGSQIWNTTYSRISDVKAISIDNENNIYLAGKQGNYTNWNIILLKVNQTGDIQWYDEWGGIEGESVASMEFNSKGDIYVLGNTYSYGMGEQDSVLLKYNSSGDLQWNKTWGNQWTDSAYDMFIDYSDNIYVVGGITPDWDEGYDISIIKYDSGGTQIFNTTWGVYDIYDFGYSIILDSSQNIYVAGERSGELILVKFDSTGHYLWDISKPYTFGLGRYIGNSVILDNSENLIITYSVDFNLGILKYNKSGHLISNYFWSIEMYGQAASENEELCESLLIDSSNNILITGFIDPDSGPVYMFLMKCNSEFGTNIEKTDTKFLDEKHFSESFHTYMEYNPMSKTYRDREWRSFATFRIEGYDDYFLIYLIDKANADNIKLYLKDEATQIENSHIVHLYVPYNFTYNRNYRFRVSFNYSRNYESCIAWTGIYCDETEIKHVSVSFLSDYFLVLKPDNGISIQGFDIYLIFGILVIMISLIQKIFKKHKRSQFSNL